MNDFNGSDMITLRLDADLEQQIQQAAKTMGVTKSELVRESVTHYLATIKPANPWKMGEDIFGKYSSGQGNLSVDRKKLVKAKIKGKRK